MNNLVSRLKVTSITTTPPAAPKKKAVASIHIPEATSVKVAPIVSDAHEKPTQNTKELEANLISAAIGIKRLEAAGSFEKQFDEDMKAQLLAEYHAYLDKVEKDIPKTLYFSQKGSTPLPLGSAGEIDGVALNGNPKPAADVVNGISVSDEVGNQIVLPVKKTSKRKKAVVEAPVEAVDAPVDVPEAEPAPEQ